jgi:hypothetical protein
VPVRLIWLRGLSEPGHWEVEVEAGVYLRQFVSEIRFDGKRVVMRGKKAALMAAAAQNEMGTAGCPSPYLIGSPSVARYEPEGSPFRGRNGSPGRAGLPLPAGGCNR